MQRCAQQGGLPALTAPTYGSMIKAYGQANNAEKVWALWGRTPSWRRTPSVALWGTVLQPPLSSWGRTPSWRRLRICLSVCLSVGLSVCLSVCLSICLSVCLSAVADESTATTTTTTNTSSLLRQLLLLLLLETAFSGIALVFFQVTPGAIEHAFSLL